MTGQRLAPMVLPPEGAAVRRQAPTLRVGATTCGGSGARRGPASRRSSGAPCASTLCSFKRPSSTSSPSLPSPMSWLAGVHTGHTAQEPAGVWPSLCAQRSAPRLAPSPLPRPAWCAATSALAPRPPPAWQLAASSTCGHLGAVTPYTSPASTSPTAQPSSGASSRVSCTPCWPPSHLILSPSGAAT